MNKSHKQADKHTHTHTHTHTARVKENFITVFCISMYYNALINANEYEATALHISVIVYRIHRLHAVTKNIRKFCLVK